jgi:hypothetical protein
MTVLSQNSYGKSTIGRGRNHMKQARALVMGEAGLEQAADALVMAAVAVAAVGTLGGWSAFINSAFKVTAGVLAAH